VNGPLVVKLGGELLESAADRGRIAALAAAIASHRPLVVVHGGGRAIDAELDRRAIAPKKVDGLRITDRPTDDVTIAVDNNTKLIRRVTLDLRKSVEKRGAPDIKAADFTVDYTATTPNGSPKADQFAWSPPAGARDAAAAKPGGSERFDAKNDLVGHPAPEIVLKDLNDKEVKPLADAKGNVILIDFWATWCPPCVEGMPNLQRIHTERSKDGIRVFAVNAMEEKDRVANFIKTRNLNLPVLLDSEGKTGEAYKVDGWPTSVVIKRDGTIHKILHPVGPEGEKALDEALDRLANDVCLAVSVTVGAAAGGLTGLGAYAQCRSGTIRDHRAELLAHDAGETGLHPRGSAQRVVSVLHTDYPHFAEPHAIDELAQIAAAAR
jgi:peroxiredoxin